MNNLRKTVMLAQMCSRRLISQTPVQQQSTKLAKIQQKFQIDDGTPVYLKGGLGDKIMLQVTVLLTLVGLGMSAEVLYTLAYPKKE